VEIALGIEYKRMADKDLIGRVIARSANLLVTIPLGIFQSRAHLILSHGEWEARK
jgi:hypothetical protein